LLTQRAHVSGFPSSSPRRRRIPFLASTDRIHLRNLPPSLLRAPPGYKTKGAAHSHLQPIFSQHQSSS
jgi:hypothetical protein